MIRQHIFRNLTFKVLLFCIGAFLITTCLADDWRMALFWDMDAFGCMKALIAMIYSGDWTQASHPYIDSYGRLFFLLSTIVVKLMSFFSSQINDLHLYLAMRWICFLFGFATLSLYFFFQRIFKLPRWFPYYAIIVTLTSSEFFHYLFSPKSQTLWIFFSSVSLMTAKLFMDAPKKLPLIAAAATAGISASALILGVFIAPTVIIAFTLHGFFNARQSLSVLIGYVSRYIFVAGIAFLVCNPRFFQEARKTFNYWKTSRTKFYGSTDFWSGQWWFHFSDFGYLTVVSAFFFVFISLFQNRQSFSRNEAIPKELYFIPGFLGYFLFLSLALHQHFNHRYLLWILPLTLVFSAKGIHLFSEMIFRHFEITKGKRLFLAWLFIPAFLLGDYNRLNQGLGEMQEIVSYKNTGYVKAGHTLLANYPENKKVLYYFYWWVPVKFQKAISFYPHIPTLSEIQAMSPDLLLLRENEGVACAAIIKAIENHNLPFKLAHRIEDDSHLKSNFLIYEHI